MDYSKSFFNKDDIRQITYDDLVNFFKEEKIETDVIEFKSFVTSASDMKSINEKQKDILKSIAAFLNSEGGIIIWGAPIERKNEERHGKKVCQGELALVDEKYEQDSFISKIANRIIPTPKGIIFHRIDHEGKYAYVFEIQKSEYSPHQFDSIYYMRLDGQTVKAPHHYIEALFKKISFPNLEAFLKIFKFKYDGNIAQVGITTYFINNSRFQNDLNLTYRIMCTNGKFYGWDSNVHGANVSFEFNGGEIRKTNFKEIVFGNELIEAVDAISFTIGALRKHKFESELLLMFGARFSPMKVCQYKIKFTVTTLNQLNDVQLSVIEENKYPHEKSDAFGTRGEDWKQKLLGRP